MNHYLLFYDVGPDYAERRAEYRSAHLEKAWAAHERGELLLAGALADPIDGAVLLFRAESADVVRRFAAADPYVVSGCVTSWRVREWTTVVGEGASRPTRP
ncbi:MAG TPA: YciI-like protein [Polyangiaceae bacterium]|nr:YciI-like protein [Polyangiaceae bacterium]